MGLRILIVDDSPIMRRIIAAIVGSHNGWTICGEAKDGLSGIQKFEELKPDLVIIDFGMPGMNGIETAELMFTINPAVPLILFTVWDTEGIEQVASKAGIRALVRKTEAWTLIASIKAVCEQKASQKIQFQ